MRRASQCNSTNSSVASLLEQYSERCERENRNPSISVLFPAFSWHSAGKCCAEESVDTPWALISGRGSVVSARLHLQMGVRVEESRGEARST